MDDAWIARRSAGGLYAKLVEPLLPMSQTPLPTRRAFLGQVSLAASAALLWPRHLRGADSAPEKRLGIALLGLGGYATHEIAPALQVTRYCRLTGVITGTPSKGVAWKRKYDLPARNVYSYDTMHQIADNPDIDIVYVITPPRHASGFRGGCGEGRQARHLGKAAGPDRARM